MSGIIRNTIDLFALLSKIRGELVRCIDAEPVNL